jgi:hypothetical protein
MILATVTMDHFRTAVINSSTTSTQMRRATGTATSAMRIMTGALNTAYRDVRPITMAAETTAAGATAAETTAAGATTRACCIKDKKDIDAARRLCPSLCAARGADGAVALLVSRILGPALRRRGTYGMLAAYGLSRENLQIFAYSSARSGSTGLPFPRVGGERVEPERRQCLRATSG